MTKYLIILISTITIIFAGENKVNVKIDGMRCAYSCAGNVTKIVESMKGVKDCKVDFASSTATIIYDEKKQNSEKIVEAFNNESNYKASVIKDLKVKPAVDSI